MRLRNGIHLAGSSSGRRLGGSALILILAASLASCGGLEEPAEEGIDKIATEELLPRIEKVVESLSGAIKGAEKSLSDSFATLERIAPEWRSELRLASSNTGRPTRGFIVADPNHVATRQTVQPESIQLVDPFGRPITSTASAYDNKLLVESRARDPKLKYEFDVASGKCKIKYLTTHGEISGEFNLVSVVKMAGSAAGLIYLAYHGGHWSPM